METVASPATAAPPTRPLLTIRPSSGWAALNLAETWQFRDLLFTLVGRDLRLRYKQTLLGVAWVIVQPLLAAGVFSLVFGMIAQMPHNAKYPYFIITFAGQLAWSLFSGTLTKSSSSMVGNAHLVSKVYFPRLVLPLSTVVTTLADFAVAGSMMLLLMIYYRINPGAAIGYFPISLVILLMLSLGLGLLFAALMVSYRDVGYILPVLTQLLMYATPVGYTLAGAQERLPGWAARLYMLNPLASVVEAMRYSVTGDGDIHLGYLTYSAAVGLILFVWGAFSFKKMERKFADVI